MTALWVVMSLKKLSAGSGYEYLTRQVAAADSTELGATPLGDYYTAKGESPGRWIGAGLTGIAGVEVGDIVTAEQMKNLFGEGCHPVTGTPLGRAYRPDAVAGFDLTFSPVKSVSTLWAVAPSEVAAAIEQAHAAAVGDAVAFLERRAIFTREGTDGVRQVEVRGLIGAAFTHRDSRSGDPDLHTHVAVANKVQTRYGRWLSVYGTVLHQHVVAASETYNTALEHHLRDRLGIEFVETPAGPGKRPVREIAGVDAGLRARWSSRRNDIDARVRELSTEFTSAHGREPTPKERVALAQRANLETRDPKHEPRSVAEQRATWRAEAIEELGSTGLEDMVDAALHPVPQPRQTPTTAWLAEAAERTVTELESRRATWQIWHLYAEAERQVRGLDPPADLIPELVDQLVDTATATLVNLTPNRDPIIEPAALRRSDGTSVYRHTGADHFTSQRMLDAEQRIVATAGSSASSTPEPIDVELSLTKLELEGTRLNSGQQALVQRMAADPRQVVLALAPAGSGKTTALNALGAVLTDLGYQPIGLAPSAAAAAVLRDSTGIATETLAKLDHTLARLAPRNDPSIGQHTVLIIDEAGMADTPTLDRVIAAVTARGAKVCLIGDDQQLAAVGAGGVLRDIATTHDAIRLEEVVRFDDPIEAVASLDLRAGDRSSLGFYLDHERVRAGDVDTCLAAVLTAWLTEHQAGRECLMLAPTRDLVRELNRAAQIARGDASRTDAGIGLADGNHARAGDIIITRRNDRRLGISGTDWVKNGDRWAVTAVNADGSLRAQHLHTGLRTTLPSDYVAADVELGYATTVHTAQGSTADVVHGIVTGKEDRQMLYTMLTRGRAENHVHVVLTGPDEEEFLPGVNEQLTAAETLDCIIDRDGAAVSATTERADAARIATQLHEAADRYADAVATAASRVLGAGAANALDAAGPGPLPWLPGIPADLTRDAAWAEYLQARADRVENLARQVSEHATLPRSLARFESLLTPELQREIVVWRAAAGVRDDEHSLLGDRARQHAGAAYARRLQRRLDDLYPASVQRWEQRITYVLAREQGRDDNVLDLARQLDQLERDGINARSILQRAAHPRRPLPAEHTVEALTYRVQRLAQNERAIASQDRRPTAGRDSGLRL